MKRTLTLAALIIAATAAAPLPSLADTRVGLYIGAAPPAPVVERIPAPRHGYVWAPGYWAWNGHRHIWTSGYWVEERPGYVYSAPAWHQGDGGWYMEPARWSPYGGDRYEVRRGYEHDRGYERGYEHDRYEHRRGGRGDEDHDGVPNRYDRDRDGDGVPNRYDRRPDNAWRR